MSSELRSGGTADEGELPSLVSTPSSASSLADERAPQDGPHMDEDRADRQCLVGGGEDSSPSPMEEATLAVLLCDGCRCPVASTREILPERHERAWQKHVYCYPFNLFEDGAEVWAYSATNPSSNRFDLLRVRPTVTTFSERTASDAREHTPGVSQKEVSLVSLQGLYSSEHSFFTGYRWCFCSCANCGHFLGWGFLAHDKWLAYTRKREALSATSSEQESAEKPKPDANVAVQDEATGRDSDEEDDNDDESPDALRRPEPDFLGIIITRCTGDTEYPVRAFDAYVATAAARRKRLSLINAMRRRLIHLTSQFQASLIAHHVVMAFDAVVQGALSRSAQLNLQPREVTEEDGQRQRGEDRTPEGAPLPRASPPHEQGGNTEDAHLMTLLGDLLRAAETHLEREKEAVQHEGADVSATTAPSIGQAPEHDSLDDDNHR